MTRLQRRRYFDALRTLILESVSLRCNAFSGILLESYATTHEIASVVAESFYLEPFLEAALCVTKHPRPLLLIDPLKKALQWLRRRHTTLMEIFIDTSHNFEQSLRESFSLVALIHLDDFPIGPELITHLRELNAVDVLEPTMSPSPTRLFLHTTSMRLDVAGDLQCLACPASFIPDTKTAEVLLLNAIGISLYEKVFQLSVALEVSKYRCTTLLIDLENKILMTLADRDGDNTTSDKECIMNIVSAKRDLITTEDALHTRISASAQRAAQFLASYSAVAEVGSSLYELSQNFFRAGDRKYTFSLLNTKRCMLESVYKVLRDEGRGGEDSSTKDARSATFWKTASLSTLLEYLDTLESVVEKNFYSNDIPPNAYIRRSGQITGILLSSFFGYFSVGLSKNDALLASLYIALAQDKNAGGRAVAFFKALETLEAPEDTSSVVDAKPEWIEAEVWRRVLALEESAVKLTSSFLNIVPKLLEHAEEWKQWMSLSRPETAALPFPFEDSDDDWLLRILILRVFRPEKLLLAIQLFVDHILGESFGDFCEKARKDMRVLTMDQVSIIHLKKGVDSCSFAEDSQIRVQLDGRMSAEAVEKVEGAMLNGYKIFIGNLEFMDTISLRNLTRRLREKVASEGFQLSVSIAAAHFDRLPNAFVENSICVAETSEDRILPLLTGAWSTMSEREVLSILHPDSAKLHLLALSFLHSLLIFRGKYRSLGWAGGNSVSSGDLVYGSKLLLHFLNFEQEVPWEGLLPLLGNYVYESCFQNKKDFAVYRQHSADVFGAVFESRILTPTLSVPEFEIQSFSEVSDYLSHQTLRESCGLLGLPDATEMFAGLKASEQLVVNLIRYGGGVVVSSPPLDAALKLRVGELLRKCPADVATYLPSLSLHSPDAALYQKFLTTEVSSLNALISKAKKMLAHLVGVIDGREQSTKESSALAQSVRTNGIYLDWAVCSWLSKSLSEWFDTLREARDQLQSWSTKGHLPPVVNAAALLHPKLFLYIVRCSASFELSLPVCDIRLRLSVTTLATAHEAENAGVTPIRGVLVSGLLLFGSGWSGINHSEHESSLYSEFGVNCGGFITSLESERQSLHCQLPVALLVGVPVASELTIGNNMDIFSCPLHKSLGGCYSGEELESFDLPAKSSRQCTLSNTRLSFLISH